MPGPLGIRDAQPEECHPLQQGRPEGQHHGNGLPAGAAEGIPVRHPEGPLPHLPGEHVEDHQLDGEQGENRRALLPKEPGDGPRVSEGGAG